MKKIIKLLCLIAVCCILIFSSLEFLVIKNSNNYIPVSSDVAIILGHSLKEDSTPDKILEERLNKGLTLYNKGLCKYIIVTGGKGPKDKIPVADAMKTWLLEKGVPEDKIFTETNSHNTYQNFKYSKPIIEQNDLNDLIVVTSDFHMYRSMKMASDFYENISGSQSKSQMSFDIVLCYFKEPFSLIKYYILHA